jgi:PAS domain S-box-containing protein
MLVLDTGGRIIDLNPAACSLFSTTPQIAIGKPVNGIAPDWQEFISLCISEGTNSMDLIRGMEDGLHFYTGSVELIQTSSGEPEGRFILLQGVTERRRLEEALRENESFNHSLKRKYRFPTFSSLHYISRPGKASVMK